MTYAPVIIPTLCRYKHFKECLESLSKCKWAEETEIFVGLDYPAKESHRSGYEKIKRYLKEVGDMTFKKIHVFEREVNYGGGKNWFLSVSTLISIQKTTTCFLQTSWSI